MIGIIYVLPMVLHTLAAVLWVGGLYFVHSTLLPALTDLETSERFSVVARIMPRFMRWVWVWIAAILLTGYGVLLLGYRGGLDGGGLLIDVMQVTGIAMVTLFVYMDFFTWRHFVKARADGDLDKAGHYLDQVHSLVRIILILGLATTAVGVASLIQTS